MDTPEIRLPRLRSLARQGLPNLIHGVLGPVGVFYLAMWLLGMWGGVIAALVWSWGTVALRVGRRQQVPGALLIGAIGLTARTVISMLSGSVFVYFLQPTIGAVVVAIAFLISVPAGRPLATKLVADFLPMPEWFQSHPAIRQFFARVTVLWGFVQLINAAVTAWLLVSQPIEIYLAAKTATTASVIGTSALGTLLWFRYVLRTNDIKSVAAPQVA